MVLILKLCFLPPCFFPLSVYTCDSEAEQDVLGVKTGGDHVDSMLENFCSALIISFLYIIKSIILVLVSSCQYHCNHYFLTHFIQLPEDFRKYLVSFLLFCQNFIQLLKVQDNFFFIFHLFFLPSDLFYQKLCFVFSFIVFFPLPFIMIILASWFQGYLIHCLPESIFAWFIHQDIFHIHSFLLIFPVSSCSVNISLLSVKMLILSPL